MRVAFKLLYQFRIMKDNSPGVYRKCEERYIVLEDVDDPLIAVDQIFDLAKEHNRSYVNPAGNKVYFEFVGVVDYIVMELECEENEFWYDFVVRKQPMENKKKLTYCRSEIKKRIRQSLSKEKEKIPYDTSKSRLNIDVDLDVTFSKEKCYPYPTVTPQDSRPQ